MKHLSFDRGISFAPNINNTCSYEHTMNDLTSDTVLNNGHVSYLASKMVEGGGTIVDKTVKVLVLFIYKKKKIETF